MTTPGVIRRSFQQMADISIEEDPQQRKRQKLFDESIAQAGDWIMTFLDGQSRTHLDQVCHLTTPEMHIAGMRNAGATARTYQSYLDCLFYTQSPANEISKIKKLTVSDEPKIEDEKFMAMVRSLPKLETLDLAGCKYLGPKAFREIAILNELKDLNFTGCDRLDDTTLTYILGKCRKLQTLNVSECHKLNGQAFAGKDPLPNLTIIKGAFFASDLVNLARRCPNLKEFERPHFNLEDGHLTPLESLQQLQSLSLADNSILTDRTLKRALSLPCLTSLILNGNSQYTPRMLKEIAKRRNFIALDLGSTRVTNSIVRSIIHNCPSLEYLCLTYCSAVSEDTIRWIQEVRPHLTLIYKDE